MSSVYKIISGVGVLIAIYLLVSNSSATVSVINTIGRNAVNGVQVLQGRDKLIT